MSIRGISILLTGPSLIQFSSEGQTQHKYKYENLHKNTLKIVLHNKNPFNWVNRQPVSLFCPLTLHQGENSLSIPIMCGNSRAKLYYFNNPGWLAALLPLLKYSASFSWDMNVEYSGFFSFSFKCFWRKQKSKHLVSSATTPFESTNCMESRNLSHDVESLKLRQQNADNSSYCYSHTLRYS